MVAAGVTVKRGRVLVIEDDPGHQRLLTQILELAGYVVTTADCALGVVALVQRLRPRVILLDLGLPLRSGAALLAELKDDPRTAAVPVVVVSAMPEVLPPERRGQADAVVAKPFSPQALLEAIAAVQWPRPVTELDPG